MFLYTKAIFFTGETVTKDEQINLHDTDETLSTTQSLMSLSTVATSSVNSTSVLDSAVPSTSVLSALASRPINADEWEKERSALYQQLDEKVLNCEENFR